MNHDTPALFSHDSLGFVANSVQDISDSLLKILGTTFLTLFKSMVVILLRLSLYQAIMHM